jgi:predicted membrane-bound mannosyltransferase
MMMLVQAPPYTQPKVEDCLLWTEHQAMVVLAAAAAVTLARIPVLVRQGKGMMAVQDTTRVHRAMAVAVAVATLLGQQEQNPELEGRERTSLAN